MTDFPQKTSPGWHQLHRPNSLLALAALAIGFYVAAQTMVMTIRCWLPVPFGDQWDNIISGREITWSWLVSQHNEHRLLFPRLIFIADRWLTGETNRLNFAVNILIQLGLTALMVRLAQGAGLRERWEKVWVAGLCLALLFWAGQWENFIWGFQVQFFGIVLAATATFAGVALLRPTAATAGLVLFLEFATVYTLASGIIVPFLAILLALWLGRPRWMIATLAVAALALLATYLAGYATPPSHSDPLDAPRHLGTLLTYMFVELGGVLGVQRKVAVAGTVGAAGAALLAFLGWSMLRRRRELSPHQAVLLALAGFVAAMSLLTAAGRMRFGLEQALSSRYATPAVAFWLSLLLLAAARAGRRGRVLVMALALPLLVQLAASEQKLSKDAVVVAAGRSTAIPALLADVADPDVLSRLSSGPEKILRESRVLRAAHATVFHDPWAGWLGTPLADHAVFVDGARCRGGFDMMIGLTGEPSPGWRAVGRAGSSGRGPAADRILLADAAGTVVGFGLGGLDPALLGLPPRSGNDKRTEWVGYFRSPAPDAITAFALLDGGWDERPAACPLGAARSVRF